MLRRTGKFKAPSTIQKVGWTSLGLTVLNFPSKPKKVCKGARDGAVMRALASHQCGPASNPGVGTICGLSLLLVLSFALRGFSLGTPVFPSPQKSTFPNSHSTRNQLDEEPWMCYLWIIIYLFIYLFCLGIKFGFILGSIRLRGIKQKKLNHHEAKPWINNTFLLIFLTGLTEPSMKFNIISKLVYFRAFWRSTIEVLEII